MKTWQTSINMHRLGFVIVVMAATHWMAGCAQQSPASHEQTNDPARDLAASSPAPTVEAPTASAGREYEIVTLLPRDAIPAIDHPQFYGVAEADREYAPDELVLGVSINGESRAYSTQLLDHHEVVNDTVGGRKIAVTW